MNALASLMFMVGFRPWASGRTSAMGVAAPFGAVKVGHPPHPLAEEEGDGVDAVAGAPLDRFRAADPVRADELPDAKQILEQMKDIK